MLLCKLIQPFPCNDVHRLSLRHVFENVCVAYYVIVLRAAPNGSRFSRREASASERSGRLKAQVGRHG